MWRKTVLTNHIAVTMNTEMKKHTGYSDCQCFSLTLEVFRVSRNTPFRHPEKEKTLLVRVQYAVTQVCQMFWSIFTLGYPDHRWFKHSKQFLHF